MKNKRGHRKTRERDLKLNCILSGIVFIVGGLAVAVFSTLSVKSNEYEQLVPIYLFCALAVGVGIFMMFAPKEIMKNEADEKNPETQQYAKIMKRRERALKRMKEKDSNENKSLKRELFGQQAVYAVVIALICFPLIGIVLLNYFGRNIVLIVVIMCVLAVLAVFFGCGFGYGNLKKYAAKNGIDFSAVEEDFRHSFVCSSFNSFISIGCIYTIFITEGHKHILENKRIISAAPFYEKVDNYNNGIYSGTTTVCSVILKTDIGNIYKIICAEFAEELIIEAFKKNQYFMSEKFTVEYSDNTPAYIQR